jgi:hypothetical protein
MAKLLSIVLAGPDKAMVKPPMFIANMIAKGGETGERYRLQHQATNGFARARELLGRAEHGQSYPVEEAFETLAGMMEPVPVRGDVFEAWRGDFERRGWPWLPSTGKQRVVYFPKGGPAGLDAFAVSLAEIEAGPSERPPSAGTGGPGISVCEVNFIGKAN